MRILLVSDSVQYHNGGANRVVVETCRMLAARGHEPAVAHVTPGTPAVDCPTFLLPRDRQAEGVQDALQRFRPELVQVHTGLSRPALDAALRGPAAVFCHDFTWVCSTGDRMGRDLAPCHRPHGLACLPLHYAQGCGAKSPIRNLRYWWKTAAMIRVRDLPHVRLQVASGHMRQGLLENRMPADRIDLVPLYSHPVPGTTPDSAEPGLVLIPSRLVPAKGVQVALESLARIRDLPWQCVVAGDGWQRGALERLATALGLADRVRFLGEIAPAELGSWYRRCRVVLFPVLRQEPFGLTGVEALAHGRPVVAFGGGGADEWLADGVSSIRVGSHDPAAFADGIARLLTDPVLWRRLAEGALARHARFLPDAYLDRLLASFSRALAPR